nr:hypothetical protein [Chloroflexia bacterium]
MSPTTPPNIVLTGHLKPGQERIYAHLPFPVPPGIGQLHLRYGYNDRIDSDPMLAGGNTLDLGLFDERGINAGSPGFRGWSGSAKDELTIAPNWATPPYRASIIGPGTWHVLLGPYKVGPRGLDYRVEIWLDPESALPTAPRPPIPREHGASPQP